MRLIRGLVDVGTRGHDAAEARRIRTVNAAALFGVIVAAGFDAFYCGFCGPRARAVTAIYVDWRLRRHLSILKP